jgi:RNA polymerase sigma factor (sigma-70 family)
MATALGSVLHTLRCRVFRQEEARLGDGDLLDSFLARRDEVAFETLLRRHGPMVLGVCRRLLGNEADAEDAFQATFLVLVRKAASIRPRSLVGNWLYGVARTTALKAKAMSSKRTAKERQAAQRSRPDAIPSSLERVEASLERELDALPNVYRAAILLCDLEGKTIKEAAQQLGCPPMGTLSARKASGGKSAIAGHATCIPSKSTRKSPLSA